MPATGSVPAATPAAERRLVSVLFADLVGFTPFAEERDSEDVRETLTRYFDLTSEVISRYGGTVEKFIGDAVMAVWGTPVAREDDAERSVRAALELLDAVRSVGPGISARVGITTGEAAVTLGAVNQGMVAGDLVNTAARLQSVAPPGTILVNDATHRAASSAIAFEAAGEQVLKGKVAPIPAWRALRVVAERGGRGRTDSLEAPFVGRDDELRLIKDLFHATVREGRTRLVSVTGIAGIGKSRLAWEFEKYLDGIVDQVWWHRGRSPAYGEGISFWSLGEMIRGRAGLAETDDERTTRVKIGELLDGLELAEVERRWVESALLALLGVETGVPAEQLFGAWRTFFERLSRSAPVVLVFEDLHWADDGTLNFIDHLLEWSRSIPLYIVTLARPELLDRRSDWGAGRRNFTSLYLEPLSEATMRELLAGLVPGLPESAVSAVIGRAEGIPLYAVETVRMLVTEEKLTPRGDGTFAPAGDLSSLAIPETLTALIAARLDGLDPVDRSLVMDAAVLGGSFTPESLGALSGLPAELLEQRLRAMVRREILTHETDPRSPERGQFAFVQALIREVAYNTLSRPDRKTRHLAAARYFESLETDEIAAALAGHYLAARDNAPEGAEADALAAQARVALRGAAERAAALGSHGQALAFLEQALAVTTGDADRAEILERAGEAASIAGQDQRAEAHLLEAIEIRRTQGDRPAIAGAITRLGRALNTGARRIEAQALLEPALIEFEDLASAPEMIGLASQLSRSLFLLDQNERAIEVADRVLAAAEHADLGTILADALVTKGSALANIGRVREGLGVLRAGHELAEELDLGETTLRAYINLSVALSVADPKRAIDSCRAGLTLASQLGQRIQGQLLAGNLAGCAIRTGDWDWALSLLAPVQDEDAESFYRLFTLGIITTVRAFRGEAGQADLAEIQRLVGTSTDPAVRSFIDTAVAEIAYAAGRLAEARTAWHRAAAISAVAAPDQYATSAIAALWDRDLAGAREDLGRLDELGLHSRAMEAVRTRILAGIAALEGRQAPALGLYREALRASRDLELAWDEALIAIDMATVLDPAMPEVQEAATRGREILIRLQARPFQARLEQLMGAASAPSVPASSSTASPG